VRIGYRDRQNLEKSTRSYVLYSGLQTRGRMQSMYKDASRAHCSLCNGTTRTIATSKLRYVDYSITLVL